MNPTRPPGSATKQRGMRGERRGRRRNGRTRAVLKDPEATTEQRLYAVAVLDNMQYYRFVPYGVKYQGSADKVAEFVAALQAKSE